MIIQNNHEQIIYYGIICLSLLLMLLGWSSKFMWGLALWGGIVISLFLLDQLFSSKKLVCKHPVTIPIIILFLAMLGTTITSVYLYNTIIGLLTFFLAGVIFLLAIKYFNSIQRIGKLVTVLLLGGLVIALYGIVNLFQLQNLYALGIVSTFGWNNAFAGFLLLIIPLSITLFLHGNSRKKNIALGILTSLFIANLYFTFSIAGWLALAFSVLLIVAFSSSMIPLKTMVLRIGILALGSAALIILLTVLYGAYITPADQGQIQQASSLSGASVLYRYYYWATALKMFLAYPLSGIGLGNFATIYPHFQQNGWTFTYSPHNTFALIAIETGIIGLAASLWFVGALLYYVYKTILSLHKRAKQLDADEILRYTLLLGLSAAATGSLVHSLVDVDMNIPSIMITWLIVTAAAYSISAHTPMFCKKRGNNYILIPALLSATFITYLLVALPLSDTYQKQGDALRNTFGASKQALLRYQKTLWLTPINAEAHEGMANAYWNLILEHEGSKENNKKLALKHAARAAELDPGNAHRHYFLGRMYLLSSTVTQKYYQEAASALEQALTFNAFTEPDYYYMLANTYHLLNRAENAKEILARGILAFDDDIIAQTILDADGKERLLNIRQSMISLFNAMAQ